MWVRKIQVHKVHTTSKVSGELGAVGFLWLAAYGAADSQTEMITSEHLGHSIGRAGTRKANPVVVSLENLFAHPVLFARRAHANIFSV